MPENTDIVNGFFEKSNRHRLLTPPPFKTLHPDHLADLTASGLTPDTIEAVGIWSLPPDRFTKVLPNLFSCFAVEKIKSVMVIPYPPLDGAGNGQPYCRLKLFPPVSGPDGKLRKYLQMAKSPNRLYIPPGVDPQGTDRLFITEGEKKAIVLTQAGYPCLGLGGVWNWRRKGDNGRSGPIPDLDLVRWKGREICIVFDSDLITNPDVQRAEKALAQELAGRGAKVFLVRLPAGPGAPKGVDDYLVAHGDQGPDRFGKLVKKAKPFKPRKTKKKPDFQPHPTRPAIQVNNRQLLEITTEALAALQAANHKPRIFVRNSQLVWIARSEQGVPQINPLGENELRNLLGSAADWVNQAITGQLTPTLTPIAIVRSVMGLGEWPFPPLRGLTSVPVLRPDGTILSTPGYDPATQLYFIPLPGAVLPSVPTDPTRDQAQEAARYLLDDLLVDFPFADRPSRANALAAMLTPVLRPAISGSVPLALVNAPKAGTGKSLLAEIFGWVGTGQQTTLTSPPQAKNEDPEWQKIITAALIEGAPVVCFDNLEGTLRSPALSLAITAQNYSARILHQSYAPRLPVRVTWYATGNNVQLGGDLPRRVYWITLDPRSSRPWERNGFRHDPLRSWVEANRGKLLECLLIMARAWWCAGQPEPQETQRLGSFEDWCRVVGGILDWAGVEGFLENREEYYERSDLEGQEWEAFLTAVSEKYGDRTFTVKDLYGEIQANPDGEINLTLPAYLTGKSAKALGRALARQEGTYYGDRGLHLVRIANRHRKIFDWCVKCN